VAKYKWQRDQAAHIAASLLPYAMIQAARGWPVGNEADSEQDAEMLAELDRRWAEHEAESNPKVKG
jgi:hypothetical protein